MEELCREMVFSRSLPPKEKNRKGKKENLTYQIRNRGELAEGWYDPAMLDRARKSAEENPPPLSSSRPPAASRNSPDYSRGVSEGGQADPPREGDHDEGGDDDDEDYGPSLPRFDPRARGGPSSGPTIPTMQDLDLRKGTLLICTFLYFALSFDPVIQSHWGFAYH